MRKKPSQQRSRQMVYQIVDSAARVLSERGIDDFGTRQVAEQAGISVGSLYQYFDGKQDLLQAIGDRLTTQIENEVIAIIPSLHGASFLTAIRVLIIKVYEVLDADDGRYLSLLPHWHLLDISGDVRRIEQRVLEAVLWQVSSDPALRGVKHLPRTLYMTLNGIVFNLLRYASEPSPYFSREELIEGLVDMYGGYLQRQIQTSAAQSPDA